MTETREQFRERMHEVGYDGAMRAWRNFQASEYAGAAEAGYAQALLDLRALARDDDVICLIPDDIDTYAAERGIDLETQP